MAKWSSREFLYQSAHNTSESWHDVLLCFGLVLAVFIGKAPVLSTPYYWDELQWIQYVYNLYRMPMSNVIPGFHPPVTFSGHPPGLFLPAAASFRWFGCSPTVAHLPIVSYAALGVAATYLLGRRWFGREAGFVAAVLLLLSPIYFAQSAMFLADLPVAALAVSAVYLAARGSMWGYVFVGVWMVMIKETANAIPAAIAAYVFFEHRSRGWSAALRRAAPYLWPLLASGLFHGVQWVVAGKPAWIYDHDRTLFTMTANSVWANLRVIHWALFLQQGQWVITTLIACALLLAPECRRRSELRQVGWIALLSGYSFALMSFLPRYGLPVHPFLCISAAGAIQALFKDPRLRRAAAGLVCVPLLLSIHGTEARGNRETGMDYLGAVRVYRSAVEFLEQSRPSGAVLSSWPMSSLLTRPQFGYVEAPFELLCMGEDRRCIQSVEEANPSRFGTVLVTNLDPPALERMAIAEWGMTLRARFDGGRTTIKIYQRPEAD